MPNKGEIAKLARTLRVSINPTALRDPRPVHDKPVGTNRTHAHPKSGNNIRKKVVTEVSCPQNAKYHFFLLWQRPVLSVLRGRNPNNAGHRHGHLHKRAISRRNRENTPCIQASTKRDKTLYLPYPCVLPRPEIDQRLSSTLLHNFSMKCCPRTRGEHGEGKESFSVICLHNSVACSPTEIKHKWECSHLPSVGRSFPDNFFPGPDPDCETPHFGKGEYNTAQEMPPPL